MVQVGGTSEGHRCHLPAPAMFSRIKTSWNSGASVGQQIQLRGVNLLQPCVSEFPGSSTCKSYIWAVEVKPKDSWHGEEELRRIPESSGYDVKGFLALGREAQENSPGCGADEGRSCSDSQPSPVTDSIPLEW